MKHLILFLLSLFVAICMFVSVSDAAKITKVMDSASINATASVPSDYVTIPEGARHFGIWVQCTSAGGAPDVDIWIETCPYTPASVADFVKPPRMSLVYDGLILETVQQDTISPPVTRHMLVRIKGNALNPADTVATVYLIIL